MWGELLSSGGWESEDDFLIRLNSEKLLKDLSDLGYVFENINQIKKIGPKDKVVIPVLLRHLQSITDEGDKEFLVRCLTVKGYTEVVPILLKEFWESNDGLYKWAIGNSLNIIQDRGSLPELVKIARHMEHGDARQMVVLAIGKLGGQKEVPLLLELLQDMDVAGHAISAIGRLKDPTLIPYLEPLVSHDSTWIRNEAKKAIKKLEKIQEKQALPTQH